MSPMKIYLNGLKRFTKNKNRYDAPKIYKRIQKEGYSCSIKRVQRLMKEAGIQ